mgnify:CR=1 FL=1
MDSQAAGLHLLRENEPEYQAHAELRGRPIALREASRKYDVPLSTLARWRRHGLICTLGAGKGKRIWVDEADVAYCAEIRRKYGTPGRTLFDAHGVSLWED